MMKFIEHIYEIGDTVYVRMDTGRWPKLVVALKVYGDIVLYELADSDGRENSFRAIELTANKDLCEVH